MAKNQKENYVQELRYIDDSVDAISNISIYIIKATHQMGENGKCKYINRLRKSVELKAPTAYDAFNYYLLTYCPVKVNSETGYLNYDNYKTVNKCPLSFIGWLRINEEAHNLFNNINFKKLEKVVISQSKIIRTSKTPNKSRPSNIIQYRSESCPACGRKFQIGSAYMIETHSCNNVSAVQNIRTISGGGGPGTGKRR